MAGTHLGRSQQQHGGPLEHLASRGDLGPPSFVFQVVLPFARQVRQFHHFSAEVTERLDELREVVHAFQAAKTSRNLKRRPCVRRKYPSTPDRIDHTDDINRYDEKKTIVLVTTTRRENAFRNSNLFPSLFGYYSFLRERIIIARRRVYKRRVYRYILPAIRIRARCF